MFLSASPLRHFFPLSLVAHAILLTVLWQARPLEEATPVAPIRLSFGTNGLSGGGQVKMAAPTAKALPPKKSPAAPRASSPQAVTAVAGAHEVVVGSEMAQATTGLGESSGVGVGAGPGGGNSTDLRVLYSSQVSAKIQSQLVYPRAAKLLGRQGTVLMRLKVDKAGNILESRIEKESPFDSLNTGSLQTIQQLGKLPPLPQELGLEVCDISVPVRFSLQI